MRQAGPASQSSVARLSLSHNQNSAFYEPTDQDRITHLQDSTRKGLFKITAKKTLLKQVLILRKELLAIANYDETTDCHKQLTNIYTESIKSQHQLHNYNNAELSAIAVSLFDLFSVLGERLKNNQRRTRQRSNKPTPTQQLLSNVIQLSKTN